MLGTSVKGAIGWACGQASQPLRMPSQSEISGSGLAWILSLNLVLLKRNEGLAHTFKPCIFGEFQDS